MNNVNGAAVAVAVSGGVDSAVCALLLRRAGFSPRGVVIRFSDANDCTDAARESCDALGIPLEVWDARADFEREVVSDFCSEYCIGRTPNPCVRCNPRVKFKALCAAADALGCERIATGHYARVDSLNGFAVLRRAVCGRRDQSYMLYALPQTQLSRLLLPLGELSGKEEVRELARLAGLPCSAAPDSQEICFIPDGDFPAFIRARGGRGLRGRFIAPDGTPLFEHLGSEHYTVGQRRGLGVALGYPVYIRRILPGGDILLASDESRYFSGVLTAPPVLSPAFASLPASLEVKIRSAAPPVGCEVERVEGGGLFVRFAQPQRAPAPGQSAVFYAGDTVVGGAIIEDTAE